MALDLQVAGDDRVANGHDMLVAPIRVVLADDRARVRRGLRLLLDRDDGISVQSEQTADAAAFSRPLPRTSPDVVVLDLQLCGGASIAAIRQLREQLPRTEIVVLTIERNPVFVKRVLDAGAAAYVLKGHADAELPEAVHCAARGERFVSAGLAAGLDALRGGDGAESISPRETEVLRLIAYGHTSAEIARELHVSRRTVDSHRASIHRKLGLQTRAELVQFALSRGLLGH
jgi:two-component system response regulator NreC